MKKDKRKNIKKEVQKIAIPSIKKDLKSFLTSEEGKITKKNVLKLGTALFIISQVLQQGIIKGADNIEFKNTPLKNNSHNQIVFSSHVSHSSHAS
ncbi:MAG: hypothetical protein ACP5IC_02840, partial [Minisyncoccia bacterium]